MWAKRGAMAAVAAALCALLLATAPTARAEGCVCQEIYQPVCAGGKTYGNECEAICAGIDIDHIGQCKDTSGCKEVMCPMVYAPVCAANGETFENECMAACTGLTIIHNGKCGEPQDTSGEDPINGDGIVVDVGGSDGAGEGEGKPGAVGGSGGEDDVCVCTMEYAPVCGKDGVTYGNPCAAACAKVKVDYIGQCADPAGCAAVACIALYDPVCGADGVTYGNPCLAGCTGVTIVSKGECGKPGGSNAGSGDGGCPCTKELNWQCGKDGISYGNPCLLKCARTQLAYEGRCADPSGCATIRCAITDTDVPVCGNDGVEYLNECLASCTGVTYTIGPCKEPIKQRGTGGRGRGGKASTPRKMAH